MDGRLLRYADGCPITYHRDDNLCSRVGVDRLVSGWPVVTRAQG